MSIDAAGVGADRCRLLRAAALAKDEAGIQIGDIEGAKLLDRDRLVVELAFFRGVVAARDTSDLNLCFLPGRLRRPHAMQADGVAPGPSGGTVLDQVATFARSKHAQPKARQLIVPDEVVFVAGLGLIDGTLTELRHVTYSGGCAAFRWSASAEAPRKQPGGNSRSSQDTGFGVCAQKRSIATVL